MKNIAFLAKYVTYLISAKNAHGIHSPFVFELYNEVINKKGSYYSFDRIEQLRKKLLLSKKEIDVTDLGTGKSGKRIVREIAGRSAKNAKYCRLLFRLAYYLRPGVILEIGTSLGISTAYLASINSTVKVITLEGCANTAKEAKKNFESLGLKNVEIIVGNFGTILPDLIHRLPATGCQLVFFDGNHRKEPTLNYFKQCLEFAHNDSVFVFDDIHWSNEMEEAWDEIKLHPGVTVTIDLFFLGIIFFRKEQAKENFVIRY